MNSTESYALNKHNQKNLKFLADQKINLQILHLYLELIKYDIEERDRGR